MLHLNFPVANVPPSTIISLRILMMRKLKKKFHYFFNFKEKLGSHNRELYSQTKVKSVEIYVGIMHKM